MEDKKQPFMFFPNIQSRIWAGIFSFTGIMIVVFWIAINEPARMQEFTDRSMGRSIENGATLFEGNCATCHGLEGYGLSGRAPALNNPHLFGYDFFEEIDSEIAAIQDEIKAATQAASEEEASTPLLDLRLEKAQKERARLADQLRYDYSGVLAGFEASLADIDALIAEAGYEEPERLSLDIENIRAQIEPLNAELEELEAIEELDADQESRIAEIQTLLEPLQSLVDLNRQREALVSQIQQYQPLVDAQNRVDAAYAEMTPLYEAMIEAGTEDAETRQQITILQQTVDAESVDRNAIFDELAALGVIVPFDPNRPERLVELEWSGGLHDLIFTTIMGGRPTSASYWNDPMAAWSQAAGGPLRDDQIESLANYILNWEREFEIDDIRNIRQFAVVPSASSGQADTPATTDGDPALLEFVGQDVNNIVMTIAEIEGDPQIGQQLFAQQGCVACHVVGTTGVGPDPTGLAIRAQEHADEDPELESAQHYIVQSIVLPNAFVVENFAPNLMPQDFSGRLTFVDMANLVAYLMSFDAE